MPWELKRVPWNGRRKPPQWFPKWNWSPGVPTGIGTEVLTDGNKSGTNTGAEVVIFTNGELIFQESLALRVDELVFSAELVAIREALRVCAEKNFSPDRLYSDCMSALVVINLEKGQLAHQIIQELEMMTRAPSSIGLEDTASLEMLQTAYGDAVMSRRRVSESYKRFKEGLEETADNERSGRPSTSTTPEKVDKVLELSIEEIKVESKKAMKAIPKTDYQMCFAYWKKKVAEVNRGQRGLL
ncbi:GVQW3 [Cordylochernes scorpioides]|uniref:GVQW3 n=1 Tax=Cordylochernes scorpioides TaxID=51811 RepID=A0ABY6LSQ5_9ARAC|nr:GVQW3 [Cordylochernes scorpioides]